MGDVHYMISETAKRVGVETHVLRYWEEELDLPIGRTEMGHRYYTEDDIRLFCCIKDLKEQGMLLKELKSLIPDMLRAKAKKRASQIPATKSANVGEHMEPLTITPYRTDGNDDLERVTMMITEALRSVVTDNNDVLGQTVCQSVTKSVIKEMDFLLQAKDRQEEERYKRLDHLIRQQQTMRKESSKITPTQRLRKLFSEA